MPHQCESPPPPPLGRIAPRLVTAAPLFPRILLVAGLALLPQPAPADPNGGERGIHCSFDDIHEESGVIKCSSRDVTQACSANSCIPTECHNWFFDSRYGQTYFSGHCRPTFSGGCDCAISQRMSTQPTRLGG